MKKLFIALLAALLLAFAACAAPQQETAAPEPAQSEPASAVSWDDLTFDRTLPLQYATQFSVSYAGEDYTRLTIGDDQTFLIVAGDAPVPDSVPADVTVLTRPLSHIYLVATAAMDYFRQLDAIDAIALSGQKEADWYIDEAKAAMDTDDKNVREARLTEAVVDFKEKFGEKYAEDWDVQIDVCLYKMQKKIVKKWLLEGKRVDGRTPDEIRPLAAEVGVLPRVHGSGLFTRGQTQVLSVCTLNTLSAAQKLDTIYDETERRYIHHYNMPQWSTGEARASRSTSRREIGHGALAEKALLPVIPSVDEFPYAIRVVSEVVSSNGSTSQASICGSTLALMDAGVPIKRPVAGISCGLISDKETGTWRTFTDIQGVEDFHGEMDFKVAGTTEGVTAIQMDLKNDGLTMEIIADALERCRKARLEILNEIMIPCIAKPRDHVSEYAPKMLTMKIDVDKIREVIGKGGSMIQKIVAESGAQVDIDDDGTIHIASPDAASCDAAKKMIDDICFVPEVGKLYYGKVVRILPIGAFVELAPGKDGMIHISKLENRRVEKVEDVLNIGDMTWVKVTEIDEKGRVNLSRKDALKELAAAADKK